jgi:putative DNA primase/helicase
MKQAAQLRLQVPFSAKDQAKGLGARWDPQQRSWYVPHGVDIEAFKAWWPEELKAQGGDLLARAGAPDVAKPPQSAASRAPKTAAVFVTGPAEVAPDLSDKLPWED